MMDPRVDRFLSKEETDLGTTIQFGKPDNAIMTLTTPHYLGKVLILLIILHTSVTYRVQMSEAFAFI